MKKFYLLLIAAFGFLNGGFAQSAINPVTGGNFDEGNTFAANGWTVVNSSGNEWVVGTTTYNSAPNSAYISVDGNPANYSYDNTKAHISHFYQKVTIPANAFNVSCSFYLQGNVQTDASLNVIDGLIIYTCLTAPVADALPGPGAVIRFPQFNSQLAYSQQSFNLSDMAGKTFYLIFTWVNNADGIGDGPPASVDDASLTYCIKATSYNVTGGGAFCTGSSGVGIGLSNSDTAISYQLYNNGNPVGGPVNGTGAALDFGPQKAVGSYTVIGTSGCNIDYPMNGSASVAENPLPTPSAGSNGPLCFGATLNLTATGGSSYSWTGPNSFTSDVQNPTIDNFSAVNAGTYTVTVTDNNGCTAPATIAVAVTAGIAKGGLLSSESICSGGSGMLTLTGNTNNPDHWEYTTDSTSVTWNPIVNTTTTLNFSGNTVPTFYRAVINDGCSNVYSDTATVSIHNLWTGADNTTDWNTGNNWSDGVVPSTSLPSNAACPTVVIPVVPLHNYPILSTGLMASITNLQIDAGASVTITGNTIQIAGTITNNGIFDVTNGTMELNGAATQNIDGNTFKNAIAGDNNTVQNLIISNNVIVANTPGDTLNITGALSFGIATAQLQTGDNITLKSSATATASVGVIGSSNTITGDVTVERYSAAINNWQFLAIPTQTTQTIHQAWQENQAAGALSPIGYGTQITGPVLANGLDFISPNPSMKYWNNGTQAYINITGTNMTFPNIENGFFLFIRGDRQATANALSTKVPTVMRTKGSLYKGAVPFNVPGNTYFSIGNPYASRVNFGSITYLAGIKAFYVWDPLIYGTRGAGGYQTLSHTNNYLPTVPTAYYDGATPDPYLESGQAAFVNNTTATGVTLTFNESNKVNGSNLVFRGADASLSGFLRTFLYNASGKVNDGNVVAFNSKYQNKLDANDAIKISNTGENLGLRRDGIILAIEARAPVSASDTIYFNLKNVSKQTYRLGFNPENMQDAGVTAYLVDNYLKTTNEVSLAGATFADFTVNADAGSYATDRFMIVFKKAVVLPVTFVSVKAVQQDKNIVVSWNVANENNMLEYDVEKSLDGNNFVKVATVTAINNGGGNYQWIDKDAVPGNNYYRIRSVDKNQKTVYSTVVNVLITNLKTGITIYPNPITDGIIHLQFINQPEGRYRISLFNSLGQLIVAKQIEYAGGNGSEDITWDYNLAHGIYQLEVRRPDGSVVIIKVLF